MRKRRTDIKRHEADAILAELQKGREGAIAVCQTAKINSGQYRAAQEVLTAIDALVGALGCEKDHFHTKAHG